MKDLTNQAATRIIEDQLRQLRADQPAIEKKIEHLIVRSGTAGIPILLNSDDLVGRYLNKGDAIGYVTPFRAVDSGDNSRGSGGYSL